MILPEAAERSFWQELQSFEEERKVTYVTNAERFGIEQGIKQGERSLILRQLTRKIGMIAPDIETRIAVLSISQLESLGEALLDFSDSADLDEWLRTIGA
jgi:predicted transposase YdaD